MLRHPPIALNLNNVEFETVAAATDNSISRDDSHDLGYTFELFANAAPTKIVSVRPVAVVLSTAPRPRRDWVIRDFVLSEFLTEAEA